MIDLQLIDKGQSYKRLKPSYIIFICTFDLYGKGRHIYTFENYCKEDKSILLGDDSVKIFLNASGELNDISRELKAFLDYVAGKQSEDLFVRKLEEAVREAKKNREWRHEYMTLLMRDQENIEKGIEQGLKKGRILGMVSTLRDLDVPDEVILQKIQEKFMFSEEEANLYMKEQ